MDVQELEEVNQWNLHFLAVGNQEQYLRDK